MPDARDASPDEFRDVCFVIMPFGKKKVKVGKKTRTVDFDHAFEAVFKPAIEEVELPAAEGGGKLRAKRADTDFHTGHISQEMFELIEYSRFAVADITGLNANVFYELGARHRAHESGTAILRQADATIPFDINNIKAFPYAIDPEREAEKSRERIHQVLTESLERNAWDSPIMLALRAQRERITADLQEVLIAAENAVRSEDPKQAHQLWIQAADIDPDNPLHYIKASSYPKSEGDWEMTKQLLLKALAAEKNYGDARTESSYSDAWRELGIAQNKSERDILPRAGEESLLRAVHYSPEDFDAWASLGGVRRRAGDDDGALEAYQKAVDVSDGHPYPLLMALKLRAKQSGVFELDANSAVQIGRAEGFRRAQVENNPPIDVPWSFFDLAEIYMYLKQEGRAKEIAREGLKQSTADWMPATFLSALEMLPESQHLPGLVELKSMAKARASELGQD